MITSWIPQGKETIVGKKYTEVMREYPGESFEKAVLPMGVVSTEKSTKVISIVSVKEGEYERAIKRITKRMLSLSTVADLNYQIETLLSGKEALDLIGLGIPKKLPM
jgi:hypothetical protein